MKKHQKTLAFWLVVLLATVFIVKTMDPNTKQYDQITYSKFIELVEGGEVASATLDKAEQTIQGNYTDKYVGEKKYFQLTGDTGEQTFKILRKAGITPDYRKPEGSGTLSAILINWFPMIFLFGLFFFFIRQMQAGGGKAMSFGKSKAKLMSDQGKKIKMKDVAGIDDAKEELFEIVDFLKDPKKYTRLGGRIPKGVLLVGPPGTGKTLMAKAVAGEADVPFFSISGSDFVEMFVGVGASRVRDLFMQGKKHAPCIIFIDEIDAVGRKRGAGLGGGHDEREQTLNQLLVEMDGFEANEGVILIAATNRIDVLDPALLRPGRFDRRITVGRPDVRGRSAILSVHAEGKPMDESVNLEVIAKGTPGFTGADLANLVNESALIAARNKHDKITNLDFEEAKDKVLMGVARKSMVISDEEKKNTAYHEIGHALVGLKLEHCDPIHKVTIIPRGGALGVTVSLPNEDILNYSKDRLVDQISMLLGGRIAEEIIFDSMTSGAANDIERATDLARKMVCNWGMSKELGPVHFSKSNGETFYGMGGSENINYSEETAERIDKEVTQIIESSYVVAKDILTQNIDKLHSLSEALISWETLDSDQISKVMNDEDIGQPDLATDSNEAKKAEA